MHLFSRNDAPIGDLPEMRSARLPGAIMMSCVAFTIPEVGTSVPFGMREVTPVASLESVQPEITTDVLAFCATESSRYSFFGSSEPAPEIERLILTTPRYGEEMPNIPPVMYGVGRVE